MGTAFCKAVTRVKEPCALRLGYKELGTFDGWVAATKNQCGEQEFSDLIKEPERKQEKKNLCILARVWNSFSVQKKDFRLEDGRIQLVATRTT